MSDSRELTVLNAAERVREIVQRDERRECGEPSGNDDGKVCRRLCAPGRDFHGGGHWFADPALDGDTIRESTARWLVTH
jgi:hypothetical protein